jgi:phosphopantothenoylcysteine decarboxylase/phosphopantothenate--cysteine ligase
MNVNMWEHPATRANLETLRLRGVHVVEPGSGYLACGMVGAGRLADPEQIAAETLAVLGVSQDLAGETVLITAGPTYEPIDPVRFLGNRSSGKMGYAIAEAAIRHGAKVVLISGPTALTPPFAAQFVPVETAEQMRNAVMEHFADASIVVKTAAVADYTAKHRAEQKIKRKGEMTLDLVPTTDILAEVGERRVNASQVIIGFAAETERGVEHAREKLRRKKVDAIVMNDVSQPGIGFGSERNAATIVTASEEFEIPEMTKFDMAQRVLEIALKLRAARGVVVPSH